MFETPTLITMTIASTRMHRALVDFTSKSSEVYVFPYLLTLFLLSVADDALGHMRVPK